MNKKEGRVIHPTAIVGQQLRYLQGCVASTSIGFIPVDLPETCYIGPYSVIGSGVTLGERCVVDSHVCIEPNVIIGPDTVFIYRAIVGSGASIGEGCIIGGFVPENTVIGNRCRILGTLTHLHNDPAMSWDHHDIPEAAPVVSDDVFVGLGALIIGGVHLGRGSYVCSGARVKSDVPEAHIVSRSGEVFHYSEWSGPLSKSSFFRSERS